MKRRQSSAIGVSPGQRRLTDTLSRFAVVRCAPVPARNTRRPDTSRRASRRAPTRANPARWRRLSEPAGPSMASPARSPPSDASAPNALAMLRPSDALVARVRSRREGRPADHAHPPRVPRLLFGVPLHVVERARYPPQTPTRSSPSFSSRVKPGPRTAGGSRATPRLAPRSPRSTRWSRAAAKPRRRRPSRTLRPQRTISAPRLRACAPRRTPPVAPRQPP